MLSLYNKIPDGFNANISDISQDLYASQNAKKVRLSGTSSNFGLEGSVKIGQSKLQNLNI